jgi:hypothetical protein
LLLRADAGCGVKISDSQESIRHVVQAAGKASTTQAARGGGRSLLYRGVRSTPMARAGERGVVARSAAGAAVGVAEEKPLRSVPGRLSLSNWGSLLNLHLTATPLVHFEIHGIALRRKRGTL